jgi:hypothetical protein
VTNIWFERDNQTVIKPIKQAQATVIEAVEFDFTN